MIKNIVKKTRAKNMNLVNYVFLIFRYIKWSIYVSSHHCILITDYATTMKFSFFIRNKSDLDQIVVPFLLGLGSEGNI